MKRRLARTAILSAALFTAACNSVSIKGGGPVGSADIRAAWLALAPTELQIHPLTRIIPAADGSTASIEIHFELLDRFGDPTKALGEIAVTLNLDAGSERASRRQISRWNLDLTDPAANARPYDRVTRTYRLILSDVPLQNLRTSDRLSLDAIFTKIDGRRLTASLRLTSPQSN